jgi:transposase
VIDLAPPDRESVGMGALAPHDRSTQELPARFSGSRPISLGRSMLARDRFVVSDTAWEKVAPLLPGKPTDPGATGKDNRLFLEAVLWRVRTGVPWRDLPGGFGKWNSVFQRFRRWAKGGVFERVFACLSGEPDFEYALVDGTIVTANQKASGARGGPEPRPSDARAAA